MSRLTSLLVAMVTGKLHLNYHEVRTLQYLSQGLEPRETQQQLQNHFEAWKVREDFVLFAMLHPITRFGMHPVQPSSAGNPPR